MSHTILATFKTNHNVEEKTLNAEIAQLVSLQDIDQEIDKIDDEIRQEQEALDERIKKLAEREGRINELTQQIDELDKERRTLEDEVSDQMANVKERQSKMMQVQTGREQTALLKEIEDAKKNVKEREERVVEIMEKLEKLNAEAEEEKKQLKGEKALVSEETEKVRKTIEGINKGKKEKTSVREKQATDIKSSLIKKYNTLRDRRNGLAVVNVNDGVCQGCFMNLPPQQFNLVLKGDKLHTCPTCQRIMYHVDTDEE